MWIPASASEIENAVTGGTLQETATFDAKEELPRRSKDLARDVAAMANDGGVLLLGVGEDVNGQVTILKPFSLEGKRERIANIVQTCLAEAPTVDIREFRTEDDQTMGYIVVVVPPSPRAPHMVIVDRDHRFYGRGPTGNVPLNQGEVDRLYQRRRQWERDVHDLVAKEMERLAYQPHKDYGYLYVFAWPVTSERNVLEQARGTDQTPQVLATDIVGKASEHGVFSRGLYMPDFHVNLNWTRHADGWRTNFGDGPGEDPKRDLGRLLDFQVNFNGSGWLVCGRAIERRQRQEGQGTLLFIEDLVAGLTTRFVKAMGTLYERAGYVGQVDLAAVVTNLQGAVSMKLHNDLAFYDSAPPISQPDYQNTTRVSAQVMSADPRSVGQELVKSLIDAVTQERYNPFA